MYNQYVVNICVKFIISQNGLYTYSFTIYNTLIYYELNALIQITLYFNVTLKVILT